MRIREPVLFKTGSGISDPGWKKNQGPGSGMNMADNFFRELRNHFRVKNNC
jgi:hypothetical protein